MYTHWCLGGVRGPESLFLSYFELQNSHRKVTRNDNKSFLGKHLKACFLCCGVPGTVYHYRSYLNNQIYLLKFPYLRIYHYNKPLKNVYTM